MYIQCQWGPHSQHNINMRPLSHNDYEIYIACRMRARARLASLLLPCARILNTLEHDDVSIGSREPLARTRFPRYSYARPTHTITHVRSTWLRYVHLCVPAFCHIASSRHLRNAFRFFFFFRVVQSSMSPPPAHGIILWDTSVYAAFSVFSSLLGIAMINNPCATRVRCVHTRTETQLCVSCCCACECVVR